MAQWIARQTSNLKVVGSTPIRGVLFFLVDTMRTILVKRNYTQTIPPVHISHGSSVGRAGDCNSDSAVIPRPVVRFRPVRLFATQSIKNIVCFLGATIVNKRGLTGTRTRIGGFRVLSDNQLHYKTIYVQSHIIA